MFKTWVGITAIGHLYYEKKLIQKPKIYHHIKTLHQNYLQKSSLLSQPYRVTPWLVSPHLQIIYHTLRQPKQHNLPLTFEDVYMPDGALTQLAWLNTDLPEHTPTIVVLHTITGSAQSMHNMLKDLATLTKWRIVLCLRRGHTIQKTEFSTMNLMGSVPDLNLQIAHIQKRLPDSPLYAVGSSAGTALLARYLGEYKHNTPIRAAFAYAPGYDLEKAFDRIAPLYDWYMAKKIRKVFFHPHQQQLTQSPYYRDMMKSQRLSKLQKIIFDFAGFKSHADYLRACNPISVFEHIVIPTMILNAEDDPICHIDNAHQNLHLVQNNPHILLVTTKHGSHCMHYQYWRPTSWAHQLIAEYLLHCHQQHLSTTA